MSFKEVVLNCLELAIDFPNVLSRLSSFSDRLVMCEQDGIFWIFKKNYKEAMDICRHRISDKIAE